MKHWPVPDGSLRS